MYCFCIVLIALLQYFIDTSHYFNRSGVEYSEIMKSLIIFVKDHLYIVFLISCTAQKTLYFYSKFHVWRQIPSRISIKIFHSFPHLLGYQVMQHSTKIFTILCPCKCRNILMRNQNGRYLFVLLFDSSWKKTFDFKKKTYT